VHSTFQAARYIKQTQNKTLKGSKRSTTF